MYVKDNTLMKMEADSAQVDKENVCVDVLMLNEDSRSKMGLMETVETENVIDTDIAAIKGKHKLDTANTETDDVSFEGKLIKDEKNEAVNNLDSLSDSETTLDGKKKKRRRRRHKGGKNHRRWKPYDKMSWQEKRALEEKETQRANQKREEAFASGHPVAPYNTTQFLMEDHFQSEAISPDLHRHNSKDSNGSNCTDSSSEYYDDDSENDGFIAKNFSDTYDNFHAERLSTMPKEELIKDYVEMEARLEKYENKQGATSKGERCRSLDSSDVISEDKNPIDIKKLLSENDRLKRENEVLTQELARLKSETNCKSS